MTVPLTGLRTDWRNGSCLALATFFLLILAASVHAASFDCAKASSEVEKLICSDDELSKLDESLNRAYQKALEHTLFKEQTIRSQKRWLRKVRDACKDTRCIKKAYEARIKELEFLSSYITIYYLDKHYHGVVNLSPFEPMSEPFKAILAMYALQIGSDCRRSDNLRCELTSSLGLGVQCSKEQISLVRKWFKNEIPRMDQYPQWAYKEIQKPDQLESICYNFPDGASEQRSWDTIRVGIRGDFVFVDAMYDWTLSADGPRSLSRNGRGLNSLEPG